MNNPTVELKKGKMRSIQRRHPWIFSGAISGTSQKLSDGDVVHVKDHAGKIVGTGFYGSGSIAVRLVSFEETPINESFWFDRIRKAWGLRHQIGLTNSEQTNIFRLVHAEGDGLPGLIVDIYGDTAILQAHNYGVYRNRETIARAIQAAAPERVNSVFDKSQDTLSKTGDQSDGFILGEPAKFHPLKEGGHTFQIDWEGGQKTGFFLDQRENRKLLGQMSAGKKVLNAFCYTGGFSVYALSGGASLVHSVDSSASALELCERNVQAMEDVAGNHQLIQADALQFTKELPEDYDIIILDPPAFAKHIKARHRAVQAYKRLNEQAIKQIKPGGMLMTFSCSRVVDKQLFNNTVMAAAINCRRSVRILHQLHQPADHPIDIYHPESEYLKGLVLQID